MIHGQTGALEEAFDIGEDLLGLAGKVRGFDLARGRIDRDLPGGEEEIPGADGLGIGTNGGRGLGGVDDFHHAIMSTGRPERNGVRDEEGKGDEALAE